MGFTKLDEGILRSSIMAEEPTTFKVWIALLAACKQNGIADVSAVFLASVCHMDIETIHKAIDRLEAPDPESRSMRDEGKRIRRVDGGFEIINYLKYREKSFSDVEAERKRRQRERENVQDSPGQSGKCPGRSASASASASASKIKFREGEWEGIGEEDKRKWKEAYPACDIELELKRMIEWIKANPQKGRKSNWRRFITNWLSRQQDRGGTRGVSIGKVGSWASRKAAELGRKKGDASD